MKRTLILLVAALALAACTKDKIETVDTPTGGSTDVPDSGDDSIDSVSFDRTVTVVYSAGGAAVDGTSELVTATVSGNHVTITNLGSEAVRYELSGQADDGCFKLYSGHKQAVVLRGVALTNSSGAAVNIQGPSNKPSSGKRTFVVVEGSNALVDGTAYTATPEGEDEKAVLFSEGKLVFSGSGTLTVTARGKAGITSDDYVRFMGTPQVKVNSSAGHGVRGKDAIYVGGGTIEVEVSANGKKGFNSDGTVRFDGGTTSIKLTGSTVVEEGDTNRSNCIKADSLFEMNSGTLTVSNSGTGGKGISGDGKGLFNGGTVTVTVTGANFGSSSGGGGGWGGGWGPGGGNSNSVGAKGIKFDGDIEIAGGVITVTASKHEGIETKGTLTMTGGEVYSQSSDDAINSALTMTISGGYVCAHSTGNDGLDANGDLYVKGGVIYAIGARQPEMALDANTERGYKLYIQGGTLVALGNLENGFQASQSCYSASSWSANNWYSITTGGKTYAFLTPASGGTRLVVSGSEQPTVQRGVTVEGGKTMLNGMVVESPTVSGGSSVSLSNYTGGGGWGW